MAAPLSRFFSGIGAKRLSAVEVAPDKSNQHEFNGVSTLKALFGTDRIRFEGHFIFLADREEQTIESTGSLTWYDARENHTTRTEFRLYYTANDVIEAAQPGDLVVIGRTKPENLAIIIAPKGSTSEQQLLWLFGLSEIGEQFQFKDTSEEKTDIGYAGKHIISSLGFEVEETLPDFLDIILKKFGPKFPKTIEFSDFARSTVKDVSPIEAPDMSLMVWLEREELLFKTLEKHLVEQKLQKGFGQNGTDVDEFIAYSLSVHNRRKSRAGYSFENHLSHLFKLHGIQFSQKAKTENNHEPDFLFPGIDLYKNNSFPSTSLTMLGLKTTAKDRWRQIIPEAQRIWPKHLITLEPSISKNQTDQMKAEQVQLVIPESLIKSYTIEQRGELLTLIDFISVVKCKQL